MTTIGLGKEKKKERRRSMLMITVGKRKVLL
jgi:hypothetical protein